KNNNTMSNKTSRRDFIAKSTLAAAGVSLGAGIFPASGNILGANDKIRVGFIGIGNRGSQLMGLFMNNADCEVAALCDVYEPYMSRSRNEVDPRYLKDMGGQVPRMGEQFPKKPKLYKDWRKLLEDKTIDAVCIATPDHWHALQTIGAIQAGKDVYVEKPLTITILEGRKMVEAQAGSKQVVAVGLNRRGNAVYQKLAKEIPTGKLGKITVARAFRVNDMYPDGIGSMKPENPPANFDWDAWLGPRASRPYQYNIAPYKFRWWSDYSSQMGNWGVHFMDVIRWMMGEKAPVAISAHGGKYAVMHDGDIPDTMEVIYEFASGSIATFSIYEASSGGLFPKGEVELRGTKGALYASEGGYQIIPNRSGQFQTWKDPVPPEEFTQADKMLSDGSSGDSTGNLVRNFLDCVKSRQTPLCTLEEGHRSTCFAHLGNIALATKERLQWDPEKEQFTNSAKANELLHYGYRNQWKMYGL
ncbi:MAG: Gfo/Idh/MocA family oxidoreductase, partial [Bacteroidales bacterium]|nr:Gfo/Idh/MocA family oxidoreductase [Bacteroidales bacterium]